MVFRERIDVFPGLAKLLTVLLGEAVNKGVLE